MLLWGGQHTHFAVKRHLQHQAAIFSGLQVDTGHSHLLLKELIGTGCNSRLRSICCQRGPPNFAFAGKCGLQAHGKIHGQSHFCHVFGTL